VIRSVVTIGGPPGSGKSTAARRVSSELGLEYRSAGELFREEARRRGMDVEAFNRYVEGHPEIDRELDRAMQELAEPGRLIEGRIQGALCRRNGKPVHYIVVTAEEEERVRRVAGRDHQSEEEARARVRSREASERERYRRFYGIDLDREAPDLTVDSTHRGPEEVAGAIESFVRAREALADR
jgi:CMP/dCMP kinase